MKQGKADRKGPSGQKVEPVSRGVNPGAVSYLGNKLGNHASDSRDGDMTLRSTPWGRPGYNPPSPRTTNDGNAPGAQRTVRPKGSQGSY